MHPLTILSCTAGQWDASLDNNSRQWCAQSALWGDEARAGLKKHCAKGAYPTSRQKFALKRIRGEAQWLHKVQFIFTTNYSDACGDANTIRSARLLLLYTIKRTFSWHVLKKRWCRSFGYAYLANCWAEKGACKASQIAPQWMQKRLIISPVCIIFTPAARKQTNARTL